MCSPRGVWRCVSNCISERLRSHEHSLFFSLKISREDVNSCSVHDLETDSCCAKVYEHVKRGARNEGILRLFNSCPSGSLSRRGRVFCFCESRSEKFSGNEDKCPTFIIFVSSCLFFRGSHMTRARKKSELSVFPL